MQFMPWEGVYVYFRYIPGQPERVMVALNKNSVSLDLDTRRFADILVGPYNARDVTSDTMRPFSSKLNLPPRSTTILELVRPAGAVKR